MANLTFKTNLLPQANNSWELGSSSLGWKLTKLNLPTSSGGSTYGLGTAGQALLTNGSTVYWGTISASDTKVTQNNLTSAGDYRILLSKSTNDTAETDTINKNTNLRFNPSTQLLSVGGSISATGNLTIVGSTTLSSTTTADLTANSLLVSGNTSFSQIPTSPTPATNSNDTSIATTAFVKNNLGGLSGAMHFKGTTTTTMSDGLATAAVTIGGSSYTPEAGDVVLYSDSEYVWTGTIWERLGRDSSFKTTQTAVTDPTASGTSTTFIKTISQNANGVITATKANLPEASTSVKGIIQITGANTNSILNQLPVWSLDPTDSTYFIRQNTSGDPEYGKVPFSTLYNYIKSKIGISTTGSTFLRKDGTWATPTDTKVNVTLGTTTKAYLLGVTTTPTGTAQAVDTIADTGVYLDTTAGRLKATSFDGNGTLINNLQTQNLKRPIKLNSINDCTIDSKINISRANKLAFLPADQIIIEKTTDGGITWIDAGISDTNKLKLFSEQRQGIAMPKINDKLNINCGLRITFTGIKYNVSTNIETDKYNYWNSNNLISAERYCQLQELYFYVNALSEGIKVKVQRAKGNNSTTWTTIFEENNWALTGWPGSNYIRFSLDTFGGGDANKYWNYRIILMTSGHNGESTLSNIDGTQYIYDIRGYGNEIYNNTGNTYIQTDHIYNFDQNKNVTFPNSIKAQGQIKTSFQNSVVPGLYCSTQTTIENLIAEVKFSSGCAGSFSLTTAYTKNSVTIPTAWYNFLYIPHRSGGVNGVASGDNCSYGILYLHCMNYPSNGDFKISFANDNIVIARIDAEFTQTPTNGQLVITDGTAGGIKSSGYAISDINNKVQQGASTTSNWRKVLLHYTDDTTSTTSVSAVTNRTYSAIGVSVQPSTNTLRANAYNIQDKVTLQYNTTTDALDFIFT